MFFFSSSIFRNQSSRVCQKGCHMNYVFVLSRWATFSLLYEALKSLNGKFWVEPLKIFHPTYFLPVTWFDLSLAHQKLFSDPFSIKCPKYFHI